MHLTEELAEVHAALVIDPSPRDEDRPCPSLQKAEAEVYILAEAHPLIEAAQGEVALAAAAKVEAAGLELLHRPSATPAYAARGEGRSHRVVDGLLHGTEVRGGGIGPAEGLDCPVLQRGVDGCQIALGQDDVRVEDEDVLPAGLGHAEVTRPRGAAVRYDEVDEGRQLVTVAGYDLLAAARRSVLHDDDLVGVVPTEPHDAPEELLELLRTVVDGDDEAVAHG